MFLYTKKSCFFIVLFFLILLVSYFVLGQFNVGLILGAVNYNLSGAVQLNSSIQVNGSNVSISIPIIYYGAWLYYVSIEKPVGWYNGSHWSITEETQTKTVTANATHLNWTANLSSKDTYLTFEVYPPFLVNEIVFQSKPLYEKNFTVTSINHLKNISANFSINSSYDTYALFWFFNGNWTNVRDMFHLTVLNNTATFYGFNTSDQYFRLQGYCIPQWDCGAWSSCLNGMQTRSCIDLKNCDTNLGMPDLTQSCEVPPVVAPSGGGGGKPKIEELNKDFDVSPKIIRLKLKENEIARKLIKIENKDDIKQKFRISSKYNYIFFENNTVFIDKGEYIDFEITISAQNLQPDSYFSKIIVFNGETEKEIIVILEVESGIKIINLHLDINPEYTLVKPGDNIIGTVTIDNLFKEPSDILLHYSLKDLDGNIFLDKQEDIHIENQLSFEKQFKLPDTIEEGSYILSVKGVVKDFVSVSSGMILVHSELPVKYIEKPIEIIKAKDKLTIGLIILLTLILIIFSFYRFKQRTWERKKADLGMRKHEIILKKRLEEQALKQELAEEKIKLKQAKLLEKQKIEEEKGKAKLKDQKRLELEKLRKAAELEMLRLQRQKDREKLLKQRQLLEEQKLCGEAKRQALLAQQKKKEQNFFEKEKRKEERQALREQNILNRRKKIREFWHNAGIYKTEEEKRQAELLKQKLREEILRKKGERLLELGKQEEEKRKAWDAKKKKLELEKINKATELERLRLQRQREKSALTKKKELLQKKKLDVEMKKQKLIEKQKIRQQKLLEKERRNKELKALRARHKLDRQKKRREFLHAIGFYKTREERKQEKLEKQREEILEMKKLEEKRNAWLARQKEIELEKLKKEEDLEILRLSRQQKEKELLENKRQFEVQRKKEKEEGWEAKSRLFKLFKAETAKKIEIPQIPRREDTLSMDILNTLIEKAYQDLSNNDLESAYKGYVEIRNIYKKLSQELKKQVVHKCIELHDILMSKFSTQL